MQGGFWQYCQRLLGWGADSTSHLEKYLATLGAFVGIGLIYAVTHWLLPSEAAFWVVASMGASAVLLFVVPHGALSQPWAVIGGHGLSALVGVTCQQLLPDSPVTPALAVALAILAMQYARCIHPPGGATALSAVIGGTAIHDLGFAFVLSPVLLNVAIILLVAVLFNCLFPWRRYPAALARQPQPLANPGGLSPEDFYHALRQVDSYLDIRFDDLLEVMQLAQQHAQAKRLVAADILLGACYSNALPGDAWAVRQVIDAAGKSGRGLRDQVIYKVVAGSGLGNTGVCRRQDMASWAASAVARQGDGWIRVSPDESVASAASGM
ncbi:HPP family protein [Aquipseudomonas ullengensis]|uniref:HPP family protein n=1 Tax=Aquipseudomonas ullengensis TaxID=2759166 RepID=A0A7W4LIC5_9GAMM|nr:HPP family protein [Pseudomonas ullengensis]MBB2493735.1 HPP family protein [Pseudomonas ullengensis]